MHEPHDPVMQRWRHPKEPRTLTGTSTVTSCLHFPGLVTVWACLTHPLWLGSTSALPEATTVLFRSTHTLLGHSKTPAGLPPSCCDAGMPVRRTTQFCLGGGGRTRLLPLLPTSLRSPWLFRGGPSGWEPPAGKAPARPFMLRVGALPAPRRLWVIRGQLPLSTAL